MMSALLTLVALLGKSDILAVDLGPEVDSKGAEVWDAASSTATESRTLAEIPA